MHAHNATPNHPLDGLTQALVDWSAYSSQIVHHMVTYADPPPSSERITEILTELIRGTLTQLLDRYAALDLERTASVLPDAVETLRREIHLVPPERDGHA